MKKIISVIISCILVVSAGTAAFAADGRSFSDTEGTAYEEAAEYLETEGILAGFPDGSFRPEQLISRAEACALVSRMLDASESELEAGASAAASSFNDVNENNWFASYIGYCAQKGFVQGYEDGSVRPQQQISLNEFATMVCRVAGDSDSSLGGTWPSNYMESAEERGLFEGLVNLDPSADGDKNLGRGNAAIIAYNYEKSQDSEDNPGEDDPSDNPGDDPSDNPSDEPSDNPLESFSGRALGIVTETGMTVNDSGDQVGFLTFMMGDGTYNLLTTSAAKDEVTQCSGTDALVYLQMTRGVVKDIVPITDETVNGDGVSYILTQTGSGSGMKAVKVKERRDSFLRYYGANGQESYFSMEDGNCIVYTCENDGGELKYDRGAFGDIYGDCYVIAYTVDEDSEGLANVVIVIDSEDADSILADAEVENGPRAFLSL